MYGTAPRHQPARAALAGAGTPHDRRARLAAHRALAGLKQTYLTAIDGLPGPRAEWLRLQVRHAEEPAELWALRAAVFDALPERACRGERDRLRRGIESVFPGSAPDGGFAASA